MILKSINQSARHWSALIHLAESRYTICLLKSRRKVKAFFSFPLISLE